MDVATKVEERMVSTSFILDVVFDSSVSDCAL